MAELQPWMIAAFCLSSGLILGYFFARFKAQQAFAQCKTLQKKLDESEQTHASYKAEVTEHFSQTASLVNQLTDKYQAVHEHLAKGAGVLCHIEKSIHFDLPEKPSSLLGIEPEQSASLEEETIQHFEQPPANDDYDAPNPGDKEPLHTAPKDYQA